ncbi:hypothetical protein [Neobacillus ginsengisoli]|uniref:Uncharacterized protein n=1 Tax=Neobacillus ginsengisoli TaxID=904295 RepID=A0ABT9XX89_9BACI|nr:hypothetical protein [Neobacillus ginsengisoli]MDQ0200194.1 hypothetical protein [Neobacillus ginsengisoli]
MATLKDKFTHEDIAALNKRLNYVFYQATHGNTRTKSGVVELQLLNIVDQLCKVSGMLLDIMEQQLDGQIETFDPYRYINGKLETAEIGIQNFLQIKKIDID